MFHTRSVDPKTKQKTQSGVDPAKPMYEAIKKVVDAYYPLDLDPNPEETSQVVSLTPRVHNSLPTKRKEKTLPFFC